MLETCFQHGGRERALGTRAPMELPTGPNVRWSMAFVFDSFTDGRRFPVVCSCRRLHARMLGPRR